MTIKEAAKELGVSRNLVYSLIERGQLHAIRNPLRLKGRVQIPTSEVEALKKLSQP